jgi:hypothetical protein
MTVRTLFLLTVVLMLSACATSTPVVKPIDLPPVDAQCDEGEIQCSGPCPALQKWTTGRYSDLEQVAIADTAAHAACAAKARACQACLQRLRDKGVIR